MLVYLPIANPLNKQERWCKMFFDSENILENKLIILYALNNFKTPLTKDQITQIILENIQISYFDVQFLVDSLKSDGFIEEMIDSNNCYYKTTESGNSTLKLFQGRIPSYIKDIINMFIAQNKDKLLKHVKYQASYKKESDEEFLVNLILYENDVILIDLYIKVVNKNQAEFVCTNWEKNGDKLYTKIIDSLINKPS